MYFLYLAWDTGSSNTIFVAKISWLGQSKRCGKSLYNSSTLPFPRLFTFHPIAWSCQSALRKCWISVEYKRPSWNTVDDPRIHIINRTARMGLWRRHRHSVANFQEYRVEFKAVMSRRMLRYTTKLRLVVLYWEVCIGSCPETRSRHNIDGSFEVDSSSFPFALLPSPLLELLKDSPRYSSYLEQNLAGTGYSKPLLCKTTSLSDINAASRHDFLFFILGSLDLLFWYPGGGYILLPRP